MRTILIGDIHGCIEELRTLVQLVNLQPTDRVICLGDFIDKGPDGPACVRFAREHRFDAVLGNHEEHFLRWVKHERKRAKNPTYKNPMRPANEHDQTQRDQLTEEDIAWFQSLPYYIKWDNFVAVHGGLQPNLTLEQQDPSKMIRLRWIREDGKHIPVDYNDLSACKQPGITHWMERYNGVEHVVYGHEAFTLGKPHVSISPGGATCYSLDNGVVHGGHLTAMIHDNDTVSFVQVKAKQVYSLPHEAIPEG